MMTPETRRVLYRSLGLLHDALRFDERMRDYAKGHAMRRETARSLWNVRKAMIELGMYQTKPVIVLPPSGECE